MLFFISPFRGLVWIGFSFFPLICIILLASSFIVVALPVATLKVCPVAFSLSAARMLASTTSSTCTKSLVCVPSP